MLVRNPDGTTATTEEKVAHTIWPCVPHGPEIGCKEAIEAAEVRRGKVLKVQETRREN
jgi:hypothetical protein